ncbi:MAG: internal scaffolding protein [Microvirus sp.]|nr:MAG: internal scaffolding protein [Microvirus sp.]
MDGYSFRYDFVQRSLDAGIVNDDPSLTVQADAEDADINTIVRRFNLTGTMPQSLRLPQYADYEDVFDFHSAQLVLKEAEAEFMRVPAHIRAMFDNNAGKFLEFCSLEQNLPKMRELGLAKAVPVVYNTPAKSDSPTKE